MPKTLYTDFLPNTDSTKSLGSTLLRWLKLWVDEITVTGTITAGAITGTSFIIGANTINSFVNLDSLADLSFASTSFVKMTATGTFGLDTNTYLTSVTAHALLSATHNDTTASTVARGDLVVGTGASATWDNLALGTVGKILRSDGTDLKYTTSTFADTYAASTLLYANGANIVQGLTTGNSGVLVTGGTGIPSIATDIPTAVTIGTKYIYRADGTDVPVADGGTGKSVFAVGDIIHATGTTTLAGLADVAVGSYLRSGGVNTVPLWSTLILPNSGTIYRLPVYSAANTMTELAAVGATGEYLKGNTGAIPSWATLNQAAVAGLTTASTPTFGASLTLASGSGATGRTTFYAGSNTGWAAPVAGLSDSNGDKLVLYNASGQKMALGLEDSNTWLQGTGIKFYTGATPTLALTLTSAQAATFVAGATVKFDHITETTASHSVVCDVPFSATTGYRIGGAATTGTILRGNATNYVATTSTFADTYTASSLLYSNGANTVTGLATGNNGVLITSGTGVPSISSTLPSGITLVAPLLGTPASGNLVNCTGVPAGDTQLFFGDGTDGDVTISANTNLTRDMYYDDLTVNASYTLDPSGFKIFVKGTLTIAATGAIAANGGAGGNGGNGGNATAGVVGAAGTAGTAGAVADAGGTLPAPLVGIAGGAGGIGVLGTPPTNGNGGNNGGTGTAQSSALRGTSAGVAGGAGGNSGEGVPATGGTVGAAGSRTEMTAASGDMRDTVRATTWAVINNAGTIVIPKGCSGSGSGGGGASGSIAAASLAGNTLISTPNGYIRIKDLNKGDKVYSWDGANAVIDTISGLAVNNKNISKKHIIINKLDVTSHHIIYTKNKGWIKAEDVKKGDTLLSDNLDRAKVKSIKVYYSKETVYDLDIEKNHNFFADKILVHNAAVLTGGGGGGGGSGANGGYLFIAAKTIANSGSITATGGAAGNGGNGGNPYGASAQLGGSGGGGGGGGGDGGVIAIISNTASASYGTVTAAGGTAGTKGVHSDGLNAGDPGVDGSDGTAGAAGLVIGITV